MAEREKQNASRGRATNLVPWADRSQKVGMLTETGYWFYSNRKTSSNMTEVRWMVHMVQNVSKKQFINLMSGLTGSFIGGTKLELWLWKHTHLFRRRLFALRSVCRDQSDAEAEVDVSERRWSQKTNKVVIKSWREKASNFAQHWELTEAEHFQPGCTLEVQRTILREKNWAPQPTQLWNWQISHTKCKFIFALKDMALILYSWVESQFVQSRMTTQRC